MENGNVRKPGSIDWANYKGFEVLTADRAIVGRVEEVAKDPDSDELFLSIDGSTGFEDVIRLPVRSIGLVSETFLMLDVVVDDFDVPAADTRDPGARASSRRRRSLRVPRDASFTTLSMGRQPTSSARDDSAKPHTAPNLGEEQRGSHRSNTDNTYGVTQVDLPQTLGKILDAAAVERVAKGSGTDRTDVQYAGQRSVRHRTQNSDEHAEVALSHVLDREMPPRLQALERRTEVLEQLMLDVYVRQTISPERESNLERASSLASNMISVGNGAHDDDSLMAEWEQFTEQSLAETDVIYLFANTVYNSLRQQARMPQDFLATWGICSNGDNVLVHLSLGQSESTDSWLKHFINLESRGFNAPITVTTENNPGLAKALETTWPGTIRIRCWAERMSSVLDEAPASVRPLLKLWLHAIRDAPDRTQGEILAERVVEQFREECPHAIQAFADDLEASLAHLDMPASHRQFIHSASLTERTFLGEQHRSQILQRLRDHDEALKIVFGMLLRTSQRWRSVNISPLDRQQIETHRSKQNWSTGRG